MTSNLDYAHYRQLFYTENWYTEANTLPPAVADWLLDTDSLTQKLQKICQQLRVEITEQGWQAVSSAPFFAKNTEQQTAWVREVVLYCDDTPCIFAQTALPQATVENVAQEVLTLGDTPIGLWLFPQKPQRLRLEWTQDLATGLYARRSLLALHGYPLAIYELFLPTFPFKSMT